VTARKVDHSGSVLVVFAALNRAQMAMLDRHPLREGAARLVHKDGRWIAEFWTYQRTSRARVFGEIDFWADVMGIPRPARMLRHEGYKNE
jgi:hypothetical protein